MDDEQLDRRLRRDPTMDPRHKAGAFRDLLAANATSRAPARRRDGASVGAPLAVVATLAVVAALIGGRLRSRHCRARGSRHCWSTGRTVARSAMRPSP